MTVCFSYDPRQTPWITPFDRYDTQGTREPDGKISTYDIRWASPEVLSNYQGTSLWTSHPGPLDDRRLCDAFSVEMVKVGFFEEVVRSQAEQPRWVWRNKNSWMDIIRKKQEDALKEIDRIEESEKAQGIYFEYEGVGMFGESTLSYVASAREFINCIADEMLVSAYYETPIESGVGFVLETGERSIPKIGFPTNEAHYSLKRLGFETWWQDLHKFYVSQIEGVPTQSMTEDERQSALNGSDGEIAHMEIVDFDWFGENMCSAETHVLGELALRRNLQMGPAMTQCGGLDLVLRDM